MRSSFKLKATPQLAENNFRKKEFATFKKCLAISAKTLCREAKFIIIYYYYYFIYLIFSSPMAPNMKHSMQTKQ